MVDVSEVFGSGLDPNRHSRAILTSDLLLLKLPNVNLFFALCWFLFPCVCLLHVFCTIKIGSLLTQRIFCTLRCQIELLSRSNRANFSYFAENYTVLFVKLSCEQDVTVKRQPRYRPAPKKIGIV